MKQLELTNLEISDLCRELALLLHAGVGVADGLYLLTEEETDQKHKQLLKQLAQRVDEGAFLHQAFEEAACFPVYVTGLLRVGAQAE